MVNVNKMDKFYEDANDQHVRSTVVYIKFDDDYVYADKECTTKVDRETLKALYLKGELVGILLMSGGNRVLYARPFYMEDVGHYVILSVSSEDSWMHFYSAEYVPEESST